MVPGNRQHRARHALRRVWAAGLHHERSLGDRRPDLRKCTSRRSRRMTASADLHGRRPTSRWSRSIEGMPPELEHANLDPLSPLGFPASQDLTPPEAALPSRSTFEEYTRNFTASRPLCSSADSPTWTDLSRDALADYVANTSYGTSEDPSYNDTWDVVLDAGAGLSPAQIPNWTRATPPLGPMSVNMFGGGVDSLLYPISPASLAGRMKRKRAGSSSRTAQIGTNMRTRTGSRWATSPWTPGGRSTLSCPLITTGTV